MFNIECRKQCLVGERISTSGFTWDWSSDPMATHLNWNLTHLKETLGQVCLSNAPDTWNCKFGANGLYTVEDFRKKLDEFTLTLPGSIIEWLKEVPLKVLYFVWRAKWGWIPSSKALEVRGVQIPSLIYGYFLNCVETADHIFIQCDFALAVHNWIMK